MENQIQQSFINGIGQEITEGDWIAYPAGYDKSSIKMGRVKKIHKKNSNHYRPYIVIIEIGDTNYSYTEFKIRTRRLEATNRIMKVDIDSFEEVPKYIQILLDIYKLRDMCSGDES